MKWYDPTRMSYGFITMNGKDVFFHVTNVRSGMVDELKPGDEVSFIIDEYDKGVIDVQLLPTLSDTLSVPTGEMESIPRDESWVTVDSGSEELAPCPFSILSDKLDTVPARKNMYELIRSKDGVWRIEKNAEFCN